jgi:putative ABC transport system substrate-binding protein
VTGDPGIGPLISELGNAWGFSTLVVPASSPQELERAFQAIVDFRSQAVIFQVDTFFEEVRGQIAEMLVQNRLPSIFGDRVHVEAGGLMSYGANEDNNARQVAIYADKILRGQRADDIPIQQPTNLEFVISRRTAERLGLKIPPAVLLQASRVIE